MWLKGFEKRNNLHLSETNCHRTINHWEVSSSSLPHYLINLSFSIYQREGYGPQCTWRLSWRNDLLENERLLNCKSPPIWGQVSLNSYTKCLVYTLVPKSPTSWTGFGKHHHRHHNLRPYCSQSALEERSRGVGASVTNFVLLLTHSPPIWAHCERFHREIHYSEVKNTLSSQHDATLTLLCFARLERFHGEIHYLEVKNTFSSEHYATLTLVEHHVKGHLCFLLPKGEISAFVNSIINQHCIAYSTLLCTKIIHLPSFTFLPCKWMWLSISSWNV